MNIQSFYNKYHKKNSNYYKVINNNNFTYFYTINFLQEAYAGKHVLDIGCGVGTLALYFSAKAKSVIGIDVSSRAINIAEKARKHLNINNVKFLNTEISDNLGKFDLALATEVIEHIEDQNEFLLKIKSNLKKEGKLLITTPSYNNLFYKIGYFKKFDKEVGHVRRYTFDSLEKVLNENGFIVIKKQQAEGILKMVLHTTRLGFIIRFIKGPLVPIYHFFDYLSIKLFGECDLQVIAIKK